MPNIQVVPSNHTGDRLKMQALDNRYMLFLIDGDKMTGEYAGNIDLSIIDVNNNVSGGLAKVGLFKAIFLNNLKVLFFCLIFSFLYGVGAIFILTWNASVVAVAMGNLIKTKLAVLSASFGLSNLASYLTITSFSFMRYMSHGFIEILSYFVAGLAGSIISVAVIKHNLENEAVLYDALDLIIVSL